MATGDAGLSPIPELHLTTAGHSVTIRFAPVQADGAMTIGVNDDHVTVRLDPIGDDRFSFGSAERLMETFGVTPGSVSPFGLLHAGSKEVRVIVDQDLRDADRLIFHPNLNTASVTITVADFERFLATRPNVVRWMKL